MTRNKILLLIISATLWSFVFSQETALTADSPSEFSPRAVKIGQLVVRIGDEGEENDWKEVQNGLFDDPEGHQSDSQATAGSYKAAETKLRHLNPSVHCGGDSMALRVQGYRVPKIMVDRGGEGVIPVSQLPENCGISTKRVRRDLLVVVQYKGCDVTQKGDDYVLPLRVWGASLRMSCPVSSTNVTADQPAVPDSVPTEASTPAPSTEASTASTVPASDAEPNWYPIPHHQEWRPFYPYRHFWPGHRGTPTGAPAPAASTVAPKPDPTTAVSSTQAVPASDPQKDLYPFGYSPYHHRHPFYPYRYFWPGHIGAPIGAPAPAPSTEAPISASTTAASTTQAVPASDPQKDWYPFGYFPYHHRHPFYPYRYFWPGHTHSPTAAPAPTPVPTTEAPSHDPTPAASTTQAVPASDPQKDWYPFGYFPYHHRHPFYPYSYFWPGHTGTPTGAPAPAPTTLAPAPAPTTASTAQAVPASDPQQEWYQFGYFPHQHKHPFYPYRHFWPGHIGAPTGAPAPAPASSTEAPKPNPTTAASTTQAVPASDPQKDWYPFGYFPYHHRRPYYPYRSFWPGHTHTPTAAPASAPTTAAPVSAPTTAAPAPAPTTEASTAQAVPASDPQQEWYPFGYFPHHHKHPFYPYRYFWPGHIGAPTGAPAPAPASSTEASIPASTTAASTAQAVPASDPQQYGYPGTIRYHNKRPFYPFGYSWPGSRDVPSTAPSASVPASDPGKPPLPVKYGQKPLYYRHHVRPGTLPCTKVPFWTRC